MVKQLNQTAGRVGGKRRRGEPRSSITSTCRGQMRADEKAEAGKKKKKNPTDERARACKTQSAKEKNPTLARAHTLIKARTHKHTHKLMCPHHI